MDVETSRIMDLSIYDFAHAKVEKSIFKILTVQRTDDIDTISNYFYRSIK